MKIAVVEDHAADCAEICQAINQYCERHCYHVDISVFPNGEDLLKAYEPHGFDILFFDIYLPGLSGVDTAREIRRQDTDCTIIFITVSTSHALDGYGVQAISYLTKPIGQEQIDKALYMCRFQLEKNSRIINVPVGREEIAILLPQIEYIEVRDKATLFHLQQGVVESRITLDAAEESLNGLPFLRCHRSFIVNMNHVKDLWETELLVKSGATVPIRKNGRREIRLALARYLSGSAAGEF